MMSDSYRSPIFWGCLLGILISTNAAFAQVGNVGGKLKPQAGTPRSAPAKSPLLPPDPPSPEAPVADPDMPPEMPPLDKEKKSSSFELNVDQNELKVDRNDPSEMAQACLLAYQKGDFEMLARLSTKGNQRIFGELAAQGETHPRYKSIMSGWRSEAVKAWSSLEPLTTKYRSAEEALVEFGASGTESFVVVLVRENGQWCFEDINSPSRADFRGLSAKPPTEPASDKPLPVEESQDPAPKRRRGIR